MTETIEIKNTKRSKSFFKTVYTKILSYIPTKDYKKRKEFAKILISFMHKQNVLIKLYNVPKHAHTIQLETLNTDRTNIYKSIYDYTMAYQNFLIAIDLFGIHHTIERMNDFTNKTYTRDLLTIYYDENIENFVKLTTILGEYPKTNQSLIDKYLKD